MSSTSTVSLWDTSAEELEYAAPLSDDVETDLAIVGGGFTGLSTAFHAAAAGIDCHVLEAAKIGYGGSGRNVGLVNAGLWLAPQDVRKALGEACGARLVSILSEAPAYVFELIERYQIRCEATQTGTIHGAHAPKGFEDLKRRAEEWRRLGAPVQLLDARQARDAIGSSFYVGGLLDRRAGTINPMGYVRGLARIAKAAGAEISTDAGVRELTRQGDRWRLRTATGVVSARNVVLATNAYTDDLWPGLSSVISHIHYFNFATEPLGEKASHILYGGQGLWDTAPIMTSIRRDAFGRLIVGSMGSVIGGLKGISKRWAAKQLQKLFPELGPVEFETAWHGRIAMTPDHLPRIHRLADGLYAPIGYNGRGIAPGTMFGKAMAELIRSGDESALPLPITEPRAAPFGRLRSRLLELTFSANQAIRSI